MSDPPELGPEEQSASPASESRGFRGDKRFTQCREMSDAAERMLNVANASDQNRDVAVMVATHARPSERCATLDCLCST